MPVDGSSIKSDVDKNAVSSSVNSETCTICLEEKDSDIKKHKDCDCVLCDGCIQSYAQHSGDTKFKCPVCRTEVTLGEDLVSVEQAGMKPNTRYDSLVSGFVECENVTSLLFVFYPNFFPIEY